MEHKERTVWLLSLLALVLVTAVILAFAPRASLSGDGDGAPSGPEAVFRKLGIYLLALVL